MVTSSKKTVIYLKHNLTVITAIETYHTRLQMRKSGFEIRTV